VSVLLGEAHRLAVAALALSPGTAGTSGKEATLFEEKERHLNLLHLFWILVHKAQAKRERSFDCSSESNVDADQTD
jgi:hypothetical protein